MKKLLLFILFIFIVQSGAVFASDEVADEKKTDFYLLATGGYVLGTTNGLFTTDKDVKNYAFGAIVGYQATKNFAVELAFNSAYLGKATTSLGTAIYEYTSTQYDYKANFLFQHHFGYRFFGILPYAGGGIMFSQKTYNDSVPGAKTTYDFGLSAKAGVRAKLAVVMIGAFVEYNYRFNSTQNMYAGIEAGFAY